MQELLGCLGGARRGLLVVGQLTTPQDCMAALRIAQALGWPVAADVLSGAFMIWHSWPLATCCYLSAQQQEDVLACKCAVVPYWPFT